MTVTIAASFPLILAFGATGAAAASALGYACGATAAWLMFRRLARQERVGEAGTAG
jgi:Na+-driven multidrug efflux pump